jgi:hypothetical protein
LLVLATRLRKLMMWKNIFTVLFIYIVIQYSIVWTRRALVGVAEVESGVERGCT